MENNYCVYKHTAPNGKVYIGITKQQPEKRWANGKGYLSNNYFTNAIKKYGWDNFKHEVLINGLNADQASEWERFYVRTYRSDEFAYGYNRTSGGEKGFKLTGEAKERFDKKMRDPKRRENVSKGLKQYYQNSSAKEKSSVIQKKKWEDEEYRSRFKIIAQRRSSDPEYRRKLSVILTEKRSSPEYRQSMTGDKNPNAKYVLQYSLDGKFIKRYGAISEACREVGGNHSNIIACATGKVKQAYGYIWAYDEESAKKKVEENNDYVNPKSKAIVQYDLDGNIIKQFQSITEASEYLNASSGTICMALNGRRKTAYGYKWKYA